jgi:hypothetical protein
MLLRAGDLRTPHNWSPSGSRLHPEERRYDKQHQDIAKSAPPIMAAGDLASLIAADAAEL